MRWQFGDAVFITAGDRANLSASLANIGFAKVTIDSRKGFCLRLAEERSTRTDLESSYCALRPAIINGISSREFITYPRRGYIARLSVCRLRSISDQERLPALCFRATFVSGLLYARSFTSFPLTDVSAFIV